jgi:hypothetical protein
MPELPENARLRSADILVWLYRERPERFTIRDIMQRFEIARGEAQRRVNYMRHAWGAVKVLGKLRAHRRGRREIEYGLTTWGQKYAARRVKGGAGRRVAANPEE